MPDDAWMGATPHSASEVHPGPLRTSGERLPRPLGGQLQPDRRLLVEEPDGFGTRLPVDPTEEHEWRDLD